MMQQQNAKGSAAANFVLFLISAALTVGAAVLFKGMFTYAGIVNRVLAGIGGVLCAIIGAIGWLVLLAAVSGGHHNIFLYDKKNGMTIPLEALTWPIVRERIGFYFQSYLQGSRRGYLPPSLEPLLMPYLLLVFIDSAPDSDWDRLYGEQSAILYEMIEGLRRFGLSAPAQILSDTAPHYRGNPTHLKRSLLLHRDSVETAIMDHIRSHIADFDV